MFKSPAQKYPEKAFLVPSLKIFIFAPNLHKDKSESADFRYDNSFSNCCPKHPNEAFLMLDLRTFIFVLYLFLEKFEGVDFNYYNTLFQIPAQKYAIRHFWF